MRAALAWLKEAGASRILVGDSPGFQGQDLVGRKSGIKEVVDEAGAEWADFSECVEVENPEGRLVKRFELARPFAEADLLMDLPRLKTHQLMYFSGAVKNLFGLVPGLKKSAFHLRFPERQDFATMLADLALAAAPDFSLMDAIVAMEGPGPNNGKPKELDLILASRDPLALDWSAAGLVGYDPASVPYLAELLARGGAVPGPVRSRWASHPDDIEISGLSIEEARPDSFELVPILMETDFFKSRVPSPLHRALKAFMVPRPFFDRQACVRCGACVRICPAKALTLGTGPDAKITIDYRACLRCYCCHEVCPEDAISLKRRLF
jgi:uncharacterized protein (DUF362 family)/Pyruvate/2-oxoacid:ferredoxin oxidoreductase delta subunit